MELLLEIASLTSVAAKVLECEENIQDALNEVGGRATGKCLEDYYVDGSAIDVAGKILTAKREKVGENYETPYGVVALECYTYRSLLGGATYISLESKGGWSRRAHSA